MTKVLTFKDVLNEYQALTREWALKPVNLDACEESLKSLKIGLVSLSKSPQDASSKQDLLIAIDILEIGALWAIKKRDIPAFERYMSQLKSYYFDYKNELPESSYKYELLGVNLLCLLCQQKKLASFHAELERLSKDDIDNSVYIKHPVSMEQYLMEGSYNKIFLSRRNVPSEYFTFFMDILLQTARDAIASCIEASYDKLALNEAVRMLFLENKEQVMAYVSKRPEWKLHATNKEYFVFDHQTRAGDFDVIPCDSISEKLIEYAKELDKIV